jgi:hypothetical protein
MKKVRKRELKKEEEDSPLLDLCYHQGLWSIHTIYVCNLSLVGHLSWIMCNQAIAAATSRSSSIYAADK